jgi:hypothetical protein
MNCTPSQGSNADGGKKKHEPGLQGRRTVGAMKQIRKEGAFNRQSIICERDIRFSDQHFATMLIMDGE